MIQYQSGYKYRLYQSVSFALPAEFKPYLHKSDFIELEDGILTIQKGYSWDGASGPTWDSKSSMQAGLKHDALYQLIREGALPPAMRAEADRVLYNTCIDDGMLKFRAWAWLKALGKFGKAATIHHKNIMVAP